MRVLSIKLRKPSLVLSVYSRIERETEVEIKMTKTVGMKIRDEDSSKG